ncbi:VOC family protein [Dermacoccaceae bacterium W4C1]
MVARVTELADDLDHHPRLALTYPGQVHIVTSSHDVGRITGRDLRLAERIERAATELGAVGADPAGLRQAEVAIDAHDLAGVRAFWAAAFGLPQQQGDPNELIDPDGVLPNLWFQQSGEPAAHRNRIHLDVWVPSEVVQERIAAMTAAGGRMVSQAQAPSFWIFADPEGNEVCLCTIQGRR